MGQTVELTQECCPDDPKRYNPRLERHKKVKRGKTFELPRLDNPINRELEYKDEKQKGIYDRFPFVPYSVDGKGRPIDLLNFLNCLPDSSKTLGAVKNSIKNFVFSQKMNFKMGEDPDFDFLVESTTDLEDSLKREYLLFIKSVVLPKGISTLSDLMECIFDSYFDNGNSGIELVHRVILSNDVFNINFYETKDYRYAKTVKDQDKFVGISSCWDEDYLLENMPTLIPLWPNIGNFDGESRTFIHEKNGKYVWYGRPKWIACYLDAYREWKNSNYLNTITDNQFTGRVFIETEGADIENDDSFSETDAVHAGFENVSQRIEENWTLKGDNPQSVIATERPYGTDKAFIYEFKLNTNEKFFKVTGTECKDSILECNDWSRTLLGSDSASGWSNEQYREELRIKDEGILKHYRGKILKSINKIFQTAAEIAGRDEFKGMQICFNPMFSEEQEIENNETETDENQ